MKTNSHTKERERHWTWLSNLNRKKIFVNGFGRCVVRIKKKFSKHSIGKRVQFMWSRGAENIFHLSCVSFRIEDVLLDHKALNTQMCCFHNNSSIEILVVHVVLFLPLRGVRSINPH